MVGVDMAAASLRPEKRRPGERTLAWQNQASTGRDPGTHEHEVETHANTRLRMHRRRVGELKGGIDMDKTYKNFRIRAHGNRGAPSVEARAHGLKGPCRILGHGRETGRSRAIGAHGPGGWRAQHERVHGKGRRVEQHAISTSR